MNTEEPSLIDVLYVKESCTVVAVALDVENKEVDWLFNEHEDTTIGDLAVLKNEVDWVSDELEYVLRDAVDDYGSRFRLKRPEEEKEEKK